MECDVVSGVPCLWGCWLILVLVHGWFISEITQSLCHNVTITFPTFVTPSRLAKLNSHVQLPLHTIPQRVLGVELDLITSMMLEILVWTLSSSWNLLWMTRRPSCSCWPKYFFHICTCYRRSSSHIYRRDYYSLFWQPWYVFRGTDVHMQDGDLHCSQDHHTQDRRQRIRNISNVMKVH